MKIIKAKNAKQTIKKPCKKDIAKAIAKAKHEQFLKDFPKSKLHAPKLPWGSKYTSTHKGPTASCWANRKLLPVTHTVLSKTSCWMGMPGVNNARKEEFLKRTMMGHCMTQSVGKNGLHGIKCKSL